MSAGNKPPATKELKHLDRKVGTILGFGGGVSARFEAPLLAVRRRVHIKLANAHLQCNHCYVNGREKQLSGCSRCRVSTASCALRLRILILVPARSHSTTAPKNAKRQIGKYVQPPSPAPASSDTHPPLQNHKPRCNNNSLLESVLKAHEHVFAGHHPALVDGISLYELD